MTGSSPTACNYLLFSDVHLGADLVQHARPWTAERLHEVHRIDLELGAMLDHYRERSDPERPWCMVIAGDFIDLIGMSISGAEDPARPLTPDEREHGLGSSQEHVVAKLNAVVARHDLLFRKIARFVDAGHSLVLIRGNHDVELYWEAAQRTFTESLLERSELPLSDLAGRQAFGLRVEFRHWFYYERGLLYVEHGHQYDASCAYQNFLAPLSPSDPDRISYSFADILLRYVVQPTRELSPEGHDANSLGVYLRLAVSLGVRGCMRLIYRFLRAVVRMVRSSREHLSEAAAAVRAEHERKLQQISTMLGLESNALSELSQLWATPVTARLRTIFRTVFLDGLALGGSAALVLVLLGVSGVVSWTWLSVLFALVSCVMYIYVRSAKVLGPHAALHNRARKLVDLMPARYVVMGHTHKPFLDTLTPKATYVNLGYWTIDLLDHHAPKSPCSHLVIRHDASGQPEATLFSWDSARGATVLFRDPLSARPDVENAPVPDAAELATEGAELHIQAASPPNLS
ncbi:MAG: hypothetical protein ABW321_27235 [Polyangiales bacterium]